MPPDRPRLADALLLALCEEGAWGDVPAPRGCLRVIERVLAQYETPAADMHEHRSPDGDGLASRIPASARPEQSSCVPQRASGHDNREAGSEPADAHTLTAARPQGDETLTPVLGWKEEGGHWICPECAVVLPCYAHPQYQRPDTLTTISPYRLRELLQRERDNAALRAQLAEAQHERAWIRERLGLKPVDTWGAVMKRLDELQGALRQCREALLKFGWHSHSCAAWGGQPWRSEDAAMCNCGLGAMLAALPAGDAPDSLC